MLKVAPVNSVAPLSPSVKVGEAPVAVRVGSSLSTARETVAVARVPALVSSPELLTPPLSFTEVRVKTRFEVLGSSLLLL